MRQMLWFPSRDKDRSLELVIVPSKALKRINKMESCAPAELARVHPEQFLPGKILAAWNTGFLSGK